MVSDPRSGMKTYLETYYTASNVTRDDGASYAEWHVVWGRPVEFIHELLLSMSTDVLFTVEEPEPAVALVDADQTAYGYEQILPVRAWMIDKYDGNWTQTITGSILKGKVEIELRRIVESQPAGSQYRIDHTRSIDEQVGGEVLYGLECLVNYRRSTTA